MHVLIVDEEVPYPLNTGKRLRSYNLLKRLQERHRVTYLCYGTGAETLPDCPNVTLSILKSPILEQAGPAFYGALLKNIASPLPYVVVRHHSELMCRTVGELVAKGDVDLIHCEWTPYTENVRAQLATVPSVLSAHNVEAQIWERYLAMERSAARKWYIRLQWQKMKTYEHHSSRLYNQVAVVSEPDGQIFQGEYGCGQVTVVANGVDQQYFAPQQVEERPASMVFTGSMDWRPNQDGVRFFIEEIFPRIRQVMPMATFTVVGRKPPQWLTDLGRSTEGVTITGTVDDVRPFIADSSLYVVPLRIGGGSRLKILEALSMQKRVLSTVIGAEGLAVQDGKNIVLRDSPEQFAAAAIEMLKCPSSFGHLAAQGRALVMEQYTWDAISLTMDEVWQKAVTSHHV